MNKTLKAITNFAVLAALLLVPATVQAENEEAYVEYADSTLTFRYDDQKASSTAEDTYYITQYSETNDVWTYWAYYHRTEVKKVVFDKSFAGARPTDCHGWFLYMSLLESIEGIQYLNTSDVTDMKAMFYGCRSLKNLDLSYFNTSKVTNMYEMFYGCQNLTGLDLSHFDTSAVTDMRDMFSGCSNLASLNVTSFNTEKVTDMSYMFYSCCNLSILDLSSFNTAAVTDTYCMFCNCKLLRMIYVGDGFTFSDDCDDSGMFYGCNNLPGYSSNAIGKEMANTESGYLTKKEAGSEAWAEYSADTKTLTFYYNAQQTNSTATATYTVTGTSGSTPGWYEHNADIEKVVFDKTFLSTYPTTCRNWFSGMSNLKDIEGLENLNTSSVTSMLGMFSGCSSLTTVDLSGFNTSSVTNMGNMFKDCTSLTELDLTTFNTSSVVSCMGMFSGCSSLKNIYVFKTGKFVLDEDCISTDMFTGCELLPDFDASKVDKAMANCTGGYFTEKIIAWMGYEDSTKTMTFYYNSDKDTTEATSKYDIPTKATSPDWMEEMYYAGVEKVVFDKSFANARPASCCGWFAELQKLTTIEGLENLNTSCTTDLSSMFMNCESLESIDLSHFDTSNVTTVAGMFYECRGLKSIDLSTFKTDKLTDIEGMFTHCTSLTDINLKGFDTSNVTDMGMLFSVCSSLETVDLSGFNTSKVTDMQSMFYGCSALKSIDLSHFDTSNVTSMDLMFYECKSLQQLDLSNFNTSLVTEMSSMFRGCSSLTDINLRSFDISKITDTRSFFYNCSSLKELDITSFDMSNVKWTWGMFQGCSSLEKLYVNENFQITSSDSSYEIFENCSKLPNYASPYTTNMAKFTEDGGSLTLRRHFTVGDEEYNADGKDAVCYADVAFGDKDDFSSDYDFTLDAANTATYKRDMTSLWATLCLPFTFNADDNTTEKFYAINSVGTDLITVEPVTGTVEAGKPLLVYTNKGRIEVSSTASADVVKEPLADANMQGTFTDTAVDGSDNNYIISKNKFWQVSEILSSTGAGATSVRTAPFRAYLTTNVGGGAKAISLDAVDDDTNGISSVDADNMTQFLDGAELYDVQGQRITTPTKGLVVVKKGSTTRKILFK
jgi:surface protein